MASVSCAPLSATSAWVAVSATSMEAASKTSRTKAAPLPRRPTPECELRSCSNLFIFDHLFLWAAHQCVRSILNRNCAGHLHLKDRFAGFAAEQNYSSSVFQSDAMSQGQAKARAFLLSLAHKRFEET